MNKINVIFWIVPSFFGNYLRYLKLKKELKSEYDNYFKFYWAVTKDVWHGNGLKRKKYIDTFD